jgi:2-polyprenyl-3-methyl-5-hydroxy-6-metoxy-1,4-benzoquinol methylase
LTKAVKTWSTPVNAGEERAAIPCTICGGAKFVPHYTCNEGSFSYVRCVICDLVQQNPQPLPQAIAARYNRDEQDYLAYETANEAAFLRLQLLALTGAGFFQEKSGVPITGTVLDVGCATGALLEYLKERGWKTRGVEISGAQADYCRKRGLVTDGISDVSSLPLEQNNFPDASFDAVLASHLVEHLNDPGAFAKEIFRIIKPGGRCYITTPNIAGFQSRLFGSRWRSAIFDHLYLFSKTTLTTLLEFNGFTAEKCVTWGGLAAGIGPGPVKALLDKLAKPLGFGDVVIIRAVKHTG